MLRKQRHEPSISQLRMNALVTGGAGFIGSHLCDRLVQSGYNVTCVDNLYTGSIENIRPLLNHPGFEFIEHDITEPLEVAGSLQRVFNLACPASPPHYQRDPIATMRTCVLGAYNMLELAKEKGARILQASTSEVYGDPEVHPQRESYVGHVNATGPRACYDEGKRAAEAMFFDYARVHGVQIKVARIFNTYGPRMMENDGRVVSNFIVQALRGEAITVYGEGSQTRSFCYVDDLIEGLMRLMESSRDVMGPVNLGNPIEVTVEEIAQRILTQTHSRSALRHLPLPQDDPKRRKPSIERATSMLGWRPRVDLDEGLRETIGYFALKLFSSGAEKRASRRESRHKAELRSLGQSAPV
jgi:UDP-glucuronate decarboxylase